MAKIEEAPVTLVVIEQDSRWPAGAHRWTRDFVAVPQEAGEQVAALVTRVGVTLRALQARGVVVERAYLVCNQRLDIAAIAARATMASALLATMGQARGGRLVLTGDPSANEALRPHLLGLAEALMQEAWDPRIEVTSSFDAPADQGARPWRHAHVLH